MKTPPNILERFEHGSQGISHGKVTLTLHIRDGHPRYTVSRKESFIPEEDQSIGDNQVDEPSRNRKVIMVKGRRSDPPTIRRYCLDYLIARRA